MKKLKILYKLMGSSKIYLPIMFITTAIVVFTGLINPIILSFVLDNVVQNEPVTNPILSFVVEKFGGIQSFRSNLWLAGVLVLIFASIAAVAQFIRGKSNGITSETVARNLRNQLYDHLQYLPYSYHQKTQTGDMIQRVTSDVDTIRRFLANQISEFSFGILTIIIAGIILFSIHVQLALLSLISIPFLILYAYFFFKSMQVAFKASDESEAFLTTVLQENVDGTRVVKAFNRERYELEKFTEANIDHRDKTVHMIKLLGQYWGISDLIVLVQSMITMLAGLYFAHNNLITVGEFIIFVSYISFILYPIRQLGRILSDFGKVSVSMDRLLEILESPIEDVETGLTPEIKGNIVFDEVSFHYEDGYNDVLMDLTFEINQGQTVAIMGPTGSGKSSLVHLMTKLYDYNGHIYLDGVELKEIQSRYLRKHVGLVLQEPFLFSKTIYENIRLANPMADMSKVSWAARIASVDQVISEFDQGYETMVGERGVTLSGGQKQRIAIARVIINECPILIFDDSLSAVDAQTDANIRAQLNEMAQKTTTIIITHRVNSAMNADKILVLDEGRIIQEGSHDELIDKPGLYQEIYKIQEGAEQYV
ncbi:MAG TPA: ABC transporter ATP-binding protein [Erysipelothrix sp.]|jgi:ATP-binding cassette subfamily B protein|nr:ABC transporter ATP-binding protein [Erysipelothrix sp.]